MMEDHERVLLNEAIALKLKLISEVQDTRGHTGIATLVLARARKEALGALVDILDADASKPDLIRSLQASVMRYVNMVKWVQEAIDQGTDAQDTLAQEDLSAVANDLRLDTWRDRNGNAGTEDYAD